MFSLLLLLYTIFGSLYLNLCVHLCGWVSLCMRCLCRSLNTSKDGIRSPGTGDTDVCEPPCGCWESLALCKNARLSTAEPSLQPWGSPFFKDWACVREHVPSPVLACLSPALSKYLQPDSVTHSKLMLPSLTAWQMGPFALGFPEAGSVPFLQDGYT